MSFETKSLSDLCEIQLGGTPHRGTLKFWDQDLLNILIDGNYIEMNHFSNYHIAADWNYPAHITESHALFLHFQGKPKPWHISFLNDSSSRFFQENYRKLFTIKKNRHPCKLKTLEVYVLSQCRLSTSNINTFNF